MRFAIDEQITFADEFDSRYTVKAIGSRFAVLTRPMTEEDREGYEYEGSIDTNVVYTIVDSETMMRGAHDWVLNPYDFKTSAGAAGCLRDLESGLAHLSRRNSIPANVLIRNCHGRH